MTHNYDKFDINYLIVYRKLKCDCKRDNQMKKSTFLYLCRCCESRVFMVALPQLEITPV